MKDMDEENIDNSDDNQRENLVISCLSNSSILPSSSAILFIYIIKWRILNNTVNNAIIESHQRLTNISKNGCSCSVERSEIIDQYLTKMIAMTQLPSFVSYPGFINFISVIEYLSPNYKICKEITLKKRLNNLYTDWK